MDDKEKKVKKKKISKKKELKEVNSNVQEFIETQKINEEERNKETFENIKQVKERRRHPILLSLVMLLLGMILGIILLVVLSVNNILTVKNLPSFLNRCKTNCSDKQVVVKKESTERRKTMKKQISFALVLILTLSLLLGSAVSI